MDSGPENIHMHKNIYVVSGLKDALKLMVRKFKRLELFSLLQPF